MQGIKTDSRLENTVYCSATFKSNECIITKEDTRSGRMEISGYKKLWWLGHLWGEKRKMERLVCGHWVTRHTHVTSVVTHCPWWLTWVKSFVQVVRPKILAGDGEVLKMPKNTMVRIIIWLEMLWSSRKQNQSRQKRFEVKYQKHIWCWTIEINLCFMLLSYWM